MYQQTTLVGNLGNDTEMRYLDNGTPVASFRMAINEKWTAADGTAKESTLWVRVTTWRKLAEIVGQFLVKGSKVMVVGKLKPANAFLDKDGKPLASIEITADEVKFLDSKNKDESGAHAMAAEAQGKSSQAGKEDIPF